MTRSELGDKLIEIIAIDEGIAMAMEAVLLVAKDDVERARLLSGNKYKPDIQSRIVHAEQEGNQKDQQVSQQEIIDFIKSGKTLEELLWEHEVQNMLQDGFSPEQIARFSELDI